MTTYILRGMHCNNCVQKIEAALSEYPGIAVTLTPPQLAIPEAIDPGIVTLQEKIKAAGDYTVAPLDGKRDFLNAKTAEWLKTYYPLFLILAFISVASLHGAESWHDWMIHFMAGFFIVFSFFKLLNLRGFADAYAKYDLLAGRLKAYGFIYPFLELGLGICYLFRINLAETLAFTILLMGYSSLGVIKAVSAKQEIRCACLGTVLNLPMSTITVIENLGMTVMAIVMLFGV